MTNDLRRQIVAMIQVFLHELLDAIEREIAAAFADAAEHINDLGDFCSPAPSAPRTTSTAENEPNAFGPPESLMEGIS